MRAASRHRDLSLHFVTPTSVSVNYFVGVKQLGGCLYVCSEEGHAANPPSHTLTLHLSSLSVERSAVGPADTSGFLCLPALAGPPDSRGKPRK